MTFPRSARLDALPPYLFADIDRKKRAALQAGRDVIDFGVGDPDCPTYPFIVEAMNQALQKPALHRYALGGGRPEFRRGIARFFQQRYGVELNPQTELVALIGSKEGIGHLPLAVVNPGQTVIVPTPGYPAYLAGTIFAGGTPYALELSARRNWLPDFDTIPADVARQAVLMFINYPNNPTGAVADLEFFHRAVNFARRHNIILAQDAAYNEMFYGDQRPPSILQVPGARDVAIEFHSASKTFNMTGWRVGFAVGNTDVIAALTAIKSNLDSGVFAAIQETAVAAYDGLDRTELRAARSMYAERAELLCGALRTLGFQAAPPPATFYVWAGVPAGCDSLTVCNRLLDEADIVGVPGAGFGPAGEGYVRFSLSVPTERIQAAVERMRVLKW
jgi:LL-diaminopimelate aminotransferase